MTIARTTALFRQGHPSYYSLPYAFHPMPNSRYRHVYLPLNRKYKPLGYRITEWLDYEEFMDTHAIRFRSDPRRFRNIWVNIHCDGKLYLYDQTSASRESYFERYQMLLLKPQNLLNGEITISTRCYQTKSLHRASTKVRSIEQLLGYANSQVTS